MRFNITALGAVCAALTACKTDADGDGFSAADDCNDADAAVNPAATEVRGNGVDDDCDGAELPHLFVGDWSLSSMVVDYEGYSYDVFEYWNEYGSVTSVVGIDEGLAASLTLEVTIQDDGESRLEYVLSGTAEPGDVEGDFSLDLEGTASYEYTYEGEPDESYSYEASMELSCTAVEASFTCTGSVTTDGETSTLAELTATRQ